MVIHTMHWALCIGELRVLRVVDEVPRSGSVGEAKGVKDNYPIRYCS
jgi:hypothetical protein